MEKRTLQNENRKLHGVDQRAEYLPDIGKEDMIRVNK
jgi:hypothetical protein